MNRASKAERTELLNLYLPILGRLTSVERTVIGKVLENGTSEDVRSFTLWCQRKIGEIQREFAEKEA